MKGPLRFLDFIIYKGKRGEANTHPKEFSMGDRPAPDESKPDNCGENKDNKPKDISYSLEENLKRFKEQMHIPDNGDIVVREFEISAAQPTKAFIVYVEGLAASNSVNQFLLDPLMVTGELVESADMTLRDRIESRLLPNNQVMVKESWDDIVQPFLMGMSVMFVEGLDCAFLVETKGWEHRTVGAPVTEQVVRGPHEGFTEHIRVNTALVRRRIRSTNLIVEQSMVGRLSQTTVAVLYIKDIANPKLIKEVKRRLDSLDTDYIPDSGFIEQYIEDKPLSLFPQTATTERPDRVAACLAEGNVAIIVDGSPFVILLPAIFTAFFQSPEDYYLRYAYGLALRLIRILSLFLALFLPGLWLAVVSFHPEMLPTPLLYAIAATRENLPFPVSIELLLLEFGFELIREAGIRVPSPIGTTIGIVGALVLGQAAVSAGIVSPTLIIVVAVTALSSFAVPSFAASFSLRVLRFPLIVLGGTLGFFGVAAGAFVLVLHLVSLTSFGVPYMSTIAPARPSRDIAFMGPLYDMERRPLYLRPLDLIRQKPVVRAWDPESVNRYRKKRGIEPETPGKNGNTEKGSEEGKA